LLAIRFVEEAAKRLGKPVPSVSPDAMALLADYPWPGNVRELENAIERAVLLASQATIFPGDLPPSLRRGMQPDQPAGPASRLARLDEVERDHILRTLESLGWNQAHAAEVLGIGRNTLWRKLKEYGIQPSERRGDAPNRNGMSHPGTP
jgi:DNA-binding NtrC family response regulator